MPGAVCEHAQAEQRSAGREIRKQHDGKGAAPERVPLHRRARGERDGEYSGPHQSTVPLLSQSERALGLVLVDRDGVYANRAQRVVVELQIVLVDSRGQVQRLGDPAWRRNWYGSVKLYHLGAC